MCYTVASAVGSAGVCLEMDEKSRKGRLKSGRIEDGMTKQEEINQLKKEKDAVILAHYYVEPEVQEIADYVGDSFNLSKAHDRSSQQDTCVLRRFIHGGERKTAQPGQNGADA